MVRSQIGALPVRDFGYLFLFKPASPYWPHCSLGSFLPFLITNTLHRRGSYISVSWRRDNFFYPVEVIYDLVMAYFSFEAIFVLGSDSSHVLGMGRCSSFALVIFASCLLFQW
jgi:hypothetical protein